MVARERAVRAVSLFQGSKSERTFATALLVLGGIALLQFGGAAFIYLRRARETRPAPNATVAPGTVAVASSVVRAAAAPSAAPNKNPPARAPASQAGTRRVASPGGSVPNELLQVAKALRLHGDTGNAIAKLQQAAAIDPQNPDVLAELALTYESMQLFDRSNESWRKLRALGAAAGPLAELADLKLRVGVPVQGVPGSLGRSPNSVAGPDDLSTIPDGSAFGISQATQTNLADPNAQIKLTLRVGVKRRPNTPIDYTKVKIQVFFYDVVNNDQVLLTDADVSYEWATPGHNWADTDTEVLDVTYERRKKQYPAPGTQLAAVPDSVEKATRKKKNRESAEETTPPDDSVRQYLGYIVRVYYQDELQAVRADPTKLLNLFPPPFTAPPQ
ncbi:MAG: tetratricopeptide repeat protein [Chthoniobacterales bacterium]